MVRLCYGALRPCSEAVLWIECRVSPCVRVSILVNCGAVKYGCGLGIAKHAQQVV